MNAYATSSTRRSSLIGITFTWALLLSMLSVALAPWNSSTAVAFEPQPSLMRATVTTASSNTLIVEGQGFTPGGPVHLMVYDRQGQNAYQDVWTVASVETYGPNGSTDPAHGFAKGGVVHHLFPFVDEPVYGPNGSQDPAYGFSRADAQVNSAEDGQDVMVRAYDVRSQTWSNVLDAQVFDATPTRTASIIPDQAPQCQGVHECRP